MGSTISISEQLVRYLIKPNDNYTNVVTWSFSNSPLVRVKILAIFFDGFVTLEMAFNGSDIGEALFVASDIASGAISWSFAKPQLTLINIGPV